MYSRMLGRRAHAAIARTPRSILTIWTSDVRVSASSPQAPIDGLKNYTSGPAEKPRISPLGDMTKARNDRKLGDLIDLHASSTGVVILATEAIVMVAQPIEGTSALS